jgi:hypothetical protein
MAPVRLVLHQLSCSNETVQNAPKHKFWVQWGGLGAFVAKISKQLHLANVYINGTCLASFVSTFGQ